MSRAAPGSQGAAERAGREKATDEQRRKADRPVRKMTTNFPVLD